MKAIVLGEHSNNSLAASTRSTVAAALSLTAEVSVLIAGYQCEQVAAEAAVIAGVKEVFLVDAPCFESPLAENLSILVVEMAASFSFLLAPASTFGKDLLPRVAAKLNVTQVSEVIEIVNESTFVHSVYAGNALETVEILDKIKVLTVRSTAFSDPGIQKAPCPIETIHKSIPALTKVIKKEAQRSDKVDLNSAKIIVAGGRGLQSAEKFALIEELAAVLGAAVGASRAAVDAGFVPNDYQIGQTGKIVAPLLYIAIGISGAVQHIAGMKDAKIIVAINKDEEAPIFQLADYGIVGDLFVVVPQLIAQLKNGS